MPAAPYLMSCPEAARRLFLGLGRSRIEIAAFAYLNGERQLLGLRHSASPWCDAIDLPIRQVVADSLAFDAAAVVMAHNHPSGDPEPSRQDCAATRLVARALGPLGIRLLDHLVVTDGQVTSFRARGLL